ncbi:MAG: histidine triad nucleotide-binding protein [Alphaproteobacteria bacterium]|nr:histidine triad nucleotide-binding protein [Alphaproteobacteria bacterium]
MSYDPTNIFAKILRGEIPCTKALETDHSLAFHDINPLAPTHVLVIPKKAYCSFDDFTTQASAEEIVDLFRTASRLAQEAGLDASGYRIISNHGEDANQEVPHFHLHVIGGRALGPMLRRDQKT